MTQNAVSAVAWCGATIGAIPRASSRSPLQGMHTSPRAQRSMKLTASGVTHDAAIVRSPSFFAILVVNYQHHFAAADVAKRVIDRGQSHAGTPVRGEVLV